MTVSQNKGDMIWKLVRMENARSGFPVSTKMNRPAHKHPHATATKEATRA